MKILMLVPQPFFSPRGTPISIRSRLTALSELGHEVDVITYHLGGEVKIPGVTILRTMKFPFIKEVAVGPSLSKIILDILVIIKAVRMLSKNKYDLLHTHEEAAIFGSVLTKFFKVRHLYDFHSSIPQAMRNFGYTGYFPLIAMLEFIERWIIKSSDGIITVSTVLDNYIRRINNSAVSVIIENSPPSASPDVNTDALISLKCVRPDLACKKIVLYTGTFEVYQGLELLIESAYLVMKRLPDVQFILVGGRPQQIKNLSELVEHHGIKSNFHFMGSLPVDVVPAIIDIADVLISTRITGNNPPLKIYEYMKSGKPIVATNIEAHTQILNNDIAVLVDPRPESIAYGIISLLDDPSSAKRLGVRSKQHFETNYSSEKKIEKMKQILDLITAECNNRS
jgi:glycosyltransferase involved in cell wall biosynthesis